MAFYGRKEMSEQLKTPVVLCVFNRLDTTKKVFEKIREARPERLYIICDAARENRPEEKEVVASVRSYIEKSVNWPCDVRKNYAESNMGCGNRISSGLTWVFSQEEQAIILEDDCVPDTTFFRYCEELLDYYRDNEEIAIISGNTPMAGFAKNGEDYFFSKVPFIWGWATWKRTWEKYDYDLKTWPQNKKNPIWRNVFPQKAYWVYTAEFDSLYNHNFDTWDYQLMYAIVYHNMLAIVPNENHVCNIGFQEESTHTDELPKWITTQVVPVTFPIRHPEKIGWNRDFDKKYFKSSNRHGFVVLIKKVLGLDINKKYF